MCKDVFLFCLSLALGYVLCVIAKKQVSVLKTLGYTLGVSIIALTFLTALIAVHTAPAIKCPCGHMHGKMPCMPMMKHK